MIRYEYKTLILELNRKFWSGNPEEGYCQNIQQKLDEMGAEGWQMVGVFPITNGKNPPQVNSALHYFMRPAGEKSPSHKDAEPSNESQKLSQ